MSCWGLISVSFACQTGILQQSSIPLTLFVYFTFFIYCYYVYMYMTLSLDRGETSCVCHGMTDCGDQGASTWNHLLPSTFIWF